MKKNLVIGLLLAVICVCIIIILIVTGDTGIQFTNKLEDYIPGGYGVLPTKIPENAKVVSFSHINFWHEAVDVYLELKFQTQEDMERYLAETENDIREAALPGRKAYIKTENIYDPSYTDLFDTSCVTWQGGYEYTGYMINDDDAIIQYDCNFGVISYSIDDLTVIHSYVYGGYRCSYHRYIPRYFTRFSVPLHEAHQRIFDVRDID